MRMPLPEMPETLVHRNSSLGRVELSGFSTSSLASLAGGGVVVVGSSAVLDAVIVGAAVGVAPIAVAVFET